MLGRRAHELTSLGAMMDDRVIDFSSGSISAFALPMMTRVSPEGTALTFPLIQPDAAMAEEAVPATDGSINKI